MGYTHEEFLRMLPIAFSSSDYEIRGPMIDFESDQSRHIKIMLGEESIRQIALLAIPTMPVKIELFGYTDDEANSYMQHFNRVYQKGGG